MAGSEPAALTSEEENPWSDDWFRKRSSWRQKRRQARKQRQQMMTADDYVLADPSVMMREMLGDMGGMMGGVVGNMMADVQEQLRRDELNGLPSENGASLSFSRAGGPGEGQYVVTFVE